MEVWDPKDKITVLSQIKSFIFDRTGRLKTWVVWLYPGILLILIFSIFVLLTGCATMKWPWEKEVVKEIDPLVIPPQSLADTQNIIACIKLQPECKLDQDN